MSRLFSRLRVFLVLFAATLISLTSLAAPPVAEAAGPRPNAQLLRRAMAVQDGHTKQLFAKQGVVGTATGIDNGQPVIIVMITRLRNAQQIPKMLEQVRVVTIVTGTIYSKAKPDKSGKGGGGKDGGEKIDPKSRFTRPVPIGVSTGNEGLCSSGTIACRVKDASGAFYLLSNNHVAALTNLAPIGSDILQPGRVDVGCTDDTNDITIATLYAFEHIKFGDGTDNENTIDAAIALSSADDLRNTTPSNGYGLPKSTTINPTSALGQTVQKYGRTTGLTKGRVTGINATVRVSYGTNMIGTFVKQIIIQKIKGRAIIQAGDSGSLVVIQSDDVDNDRRPVGLMFAGNSSGSLAVANPIDLVLSQFGVTIDGE